MDFIECAGMPYLFPSNEPTDDCNEEEAECGDASVNFDPSAEWKEF